MPDKCAAIVVAAGRGDRLGAGCPKALVQLAGRSLLERSLRGLAASGRFARFVVVVPPDQISDPRWASAAEAAACGPPLRLVAGGARRRDSVRAGLAGAGEAGLVAVHDAARPLVSSELVQRVLEAAAAVGAAVPAVPLSDTVIREDDGRLGDLVCRDALRSVQTPQAFRAGVLLEAHERAPAELDATDDAGLVHRIGREVAVVAGDPSNLKITWPRDLAAAAAMLRERAGERGGEAVSETSARRVGLGWDVHPFEEGRSFRLVGVTVAEEFGPRGHSDGDPLAHAVADALLGAAALGDIGTAFPDDDPRWEGVSGSEVLERTVTMLARAGWRPAQLDAVLVTDRPKIAPHRDAIRARLAALLGLPAERISVKGKRTEGLGGLAGGRGVSCQAIVALEPVG
jgi:2-C-methyl-D-erythritol 4-phosphate cytidylyltransferase/2-C-methyl-D-erythritol 2,4-cyclodiphosphate synthase